ncbi:MAG TPA: protein kinase [Kofleriaceae bacterium]|nr:protein kinase [Kofleriaceae bacterium]
MPPKDDKNAGELGSAPTTPAPEGTIAQDPLASAQRPPPPKGTVSQDPLGSAQTTPAPEGTIAVQGSGDGPIIVRGTGANAERDALAAGSGTPDSTLGMPPGEQPPPGSGPDAVGNIIGHFRVVRRLGMGGMGVVFACEDTSLGRQVAVKLVREEHPAYRARLLREAQAMARLEHPNVVRVYEVGTDRGRMFIAMELVEGETLTGWLRSFRTWQDVVEMFLQVGAGLAAVHGAGLVHRDFKPDNVLVDRQGRARVADFGLARLDAKDPSPLAQPLTKSGVMMGTPGYMAPEQQFGADVDARADQYSFCIALREALGGRPVDDARWAAVPDAIRAVVNRGLSYEPLDRYPSMSELLAALRAVPRYPQPTVAGMAAAGREPRWMIALLVLAVLGVVAGVVAFVGTRKHDRPQAQLVADARTEVVDHAPLADAPREETVVLADAGVAVVEPPPDARRAVTGHAPPRDAAVAVTADAAVQVASGLPLPVTIPTTKHLDEAIVGHPKHLPVIRKVLAYLGWDGYDAKWSADDLEKTIDSSTGSDKATAQVQLAMIKRKKGDCATASVLWDEAMKALPAFDPEEVATWRARAALGRALCTLSTGDGAEAQKQVAYAWNKGNRSEVQFVMGMCEYELGHKDVAYAHMLTVERMPGAAVQQALKAWLDLQGLTLR